MPEAPPHAVRCLKDEPSGSVWVVEPSPGDARVVKAWPRDASLALKLLLGIAQPQRQIAGGDRARRAGVSTPRALGSWRRRDGAIEVEYVYVPGVTALDALRDGLDDEDVERAVAARLGAIVARLAAAGFVNRDLKLRNLVIEDVTNAVWMIDPVGVQRSRDRAAATERMLERLAAEPVTFDVLVPRELAIIVLHHALRPLTRKQRRKAIAGLRARGKQS